MRTTGIGTSLVLIATGAVLAFAVHLQTTGIDLNVIGAILMVVGIIGLILSFVMLGEFGMLYSDRTHDHTDTVTTTSYGPPTGYVEPPEEVVRRESIRRY